MVSRIEYKVELTSKYQKLYREGLNKKASTLSTITVGAMRGHEDDIIMDNLPRSLENLDTSEVINLISYFALGGKNLDDILKNIKYKRVK